MAEKNNIIICFLQAIKLVLESSATKRIFMLILLLGFSTAFSFAVGEDQRNYFVIGIMTLSCVVFLFTFSKFNSGELYVYGFYLSLMMCLLLHPKTFRGSSLAYTLMFTLTFIVYLRMLHTEVLQFHTYLKMLKFIICAYFFVLLIQQLCVVANLPVFNFIIGGDSKFKLNALSPEPSHSARILIILIYSFVFMRETELKRTYRLFSDGFTDWHVWLCFLYTMLTMGSGTAYFLLPLLLIRFVSVPTLFWSGGAFFCLLAVGSFQGIDNIAMNRALTFGRALLTNSPSEILNADHSASIRVLPVYFYLEQVRLFSSDFWLGKGIDYNITLFTSLMPGVPENFSFGGITTLFLNQGMVAGILLVLMVYQNCLPKLWSYSTLLCVVLIFACGINIQITWLVFMLLASNRFFQTQQTRVPSQ
jgi:hypothetical protein